VLYFHQLRVKAVENDNQYRLSIDIFNVESLPMARLAEYMTQLAAMLGNRDRVHFSHLEPGSAVLVTSVEAEAFAEVEEQVSQVAQGNGPKDAMAAFRAIDAMLAKDGAVATLTTSTKGNIIEFPGRLRPKPVKYGPFREQGTLDGCIIRIGGRDETIPVWIKRGEVEYYCSVRDAAVAKRLAAHYLEVVRVSGNGKWLREESGQWTLQRFDINDFEVLDDCSIADVVGRLREVEGAHWHESEDALSDILGLRRDEQDLQ